MLTWLAANAIESDTLPADLAERHDHYLYGSPRRTTNGSGDFTSPTPPSGLRFRGNETSTTSAQSRRAGLFCSLRAQS